jgi:CRP/FNR family transcriptional regulator, cyclic AMP receptor protein
MNSSTAKATPPAELAENLRLLAGLPCFADFPPKAHKLLALLAERLHFARGDIIFEPGEDFGRFYLVLQGRLHLLTEGEEEDRLVREFQANEFLGTFSLLGVLPALFSLEAAGTSTVLSLGRQQFEKILDLMPECRKSYHQALLQDLHRWERRNSLRRDGDPRHHLGATAL